MREVSGNAYQVSNKAIFFLLQAHPYYSPNYLYSCSYRTVLWRDETREAAEESLKRRRFLSGWDGGGGESSDGCPIERVLAKGFHL